MTTVRLEWRERTAVITLDRPERRNALDLDALKEMAEVLGQVVEARAVVLAATGKTFSAGRDLKDERIAAGDPEKMLAEHFNPLVATLYELPCPTFAAVQGAALGTGFGLAFACDIVIAAEDAQVGSPFAKLGGLPDCGFHFLAASRIGMRRTLELIYTGRLLNGREAEEIGLVNRCVPAEDLLAVTLEMAESAAQGPTAAFALSKKLLRAAEDDAMSLVEVLAAEAKDQATALRTADAQEGLTAFLERRAPVFRGS
jgi:2-(1,2-epoxy-1,2-dihydrophenyl)acetyl-CoA isomerase